ncbi:MAG: sigma-70 family RNA polymerase sigma factor [Myxococcales bacterium]|nr:sigma-70 family RNA polymerase sigma factor [Myxococcales bacterium]
MTDAERAFSKIYKEHGKLIWRLVRYFGVPHDEVDDIAQEVWLTAHLRFGEIDLKRPIRPWLAKVAHHHVSHRRRSEARSFRRIQAFAESGASDRVDDPWGARESAWVLQHLLSELPDAQLEALLLCEVEGYTAPEVSRALDVPVNTVSSRLRLARRHCHERAASIGVVAWVLILRAHSATLNPTPQAIAQVAAVLAALPSPVTQAIVVAAAGKGKLALASTVALVSLTVAGAIGLGTVDAAKVQIEAVELPATPLRGALTPQTRVPEEREVLIAEVLAPPSSPAIEPSPSRSRTRPRSRPSVAPPEPTQADPTPPPSQSTPKSIRGSNAILLEAKRLLAEGRRSQALSLLDEHLRDYPEGPSADTRDLLRIRIHCMKGDVDRALAVARRYPSDPLFRGLAVDPCAAP